MPALLADAVKPLHAALNGMIQRADVGQKHLAERYVTLPLLPVLRVLRQVVAEARTRAVFVEVAQVEKLRREVVAQRAQPRDGVYLWRGR